MSFQHVILSAGAALVFLAMAAHGQGRHEPLVQELLQAEAVYPQERKELQVTIVPRLTHWAGERLQQGALVVEYGVTHQWQLEAEVASYRYRATRHGTWVRGVSRVEIGARRSWMAISGSATHIALGLGLDIPVQAVGNNNDAKEAIAVQSMLIVARDFARLHGLQLLGNVVMDVPVRHQGDLMSISTHAAALLPVSVVRLIVEANWMPDERPGDERQHVSVTPGVVVPLWGTLELAAGMPLRTHHAAQHSDFILKVTYEF